MLYFVQFADGGPVKIGTTENLPARLRALETAYDKPLVLLGTMEGSFAEERAVHEQFAHLRLGQTEQFRPAPDLMAFLGRPLFVGPNPDAVEAMPFDDRRKPMVVQIRGSAEWKAWAEGLAEKDGDTLAKLVERALRKWAKEAGYPDPPKR